MDSVKKGCTVAVVKKIVKRVAARRVAVEVVEQVANYIPIIGDLISAPLAYSGTYYTLNAILDELESVALKVVEVAAAESANAT